MIATARRLQDSGKCAVRIVEIVQRFGLGRGKVGIRKQAVVPGMPMPVGVEVDYKPVPVLEIEVEVEVVVVDADTQLLRQPQIQKTT